MTVVNKLPYQVVPRAWSTWNSHAFQQGGQNWYKYFGKMFGSIYENCTYTFWERLRAGGKGAAEDEIIG